MIPNITTYYHTVKYLKPKQIIYRSINRLRKFTSKWFLPSSSPKAIHLKLQASINTYVEYEESNTFNFLNISRSYGSIIDWNDLSQGKLWLYHLCSMNYLGQESLGKDLGEMLIKSVTTYDKLKSGEEPYPVSLRLINIIKFVLKHEIHDAKTDQKLWQWVSLLRRNIEYHLMGNHLLENGFALLFSAVYFNDPGLLKTSKKILFLQLEEQILEDGGHFELSPMYHSILLYRLLDCYNLLINNDIPDTIQIKQHIQQKAQLMLGWLQQITWEDGTFPMVNDSTDRIAPSPKALLSYANRLQIKPKKVPLSDCGYRIFRFGNYQLLCDLGKIGPDYIPGHAHNDIFNFILHIAGRPFIVDTGLSTYEMANRRQHERSTAAHNTVCIQPYEQAETWAQFRVARRGHPIIEKDNDHACTGVYTYPYKKIQHRRSFKMDERKIQIEDRINVNLKACAYLHFHEDVSLDFQNNEIITNLARIKFEGANHIYTKPYERAQSFNLRSKAMMVAIEFNKTLKTTIDIN